MNRRTVRPVRRSRPERGVAALWFAALAVVLLGAAAFAIDASYYLYEGNRQQKAADLAATAGSVFLPDNPAEAIAVAKQTAQSNGFDPAIVTAIPGSGKTANQLKVTIVDTYGTFFGRVLGRTGTPVGRASTAEFLPPLGLGSPLNTLGNDPEGDPAVQPNLWISQHGPWTMKHNGDRFGADSCAPDLSVSNPEVYRCTSTSDVRGDNLDYAAVGHRGYRYQVRANAVPPGADLVIEAFDPISSMVGISCANLPDAATRAALAAWVPDAPTRYIRGSEPGGFRWCTSEMNLRSGSTEPTPMEMVVQQVGSGGSLGPAICTQVYDSYRLTPGGTTPRSGTVAELVNPTDGVEDAGGVRTPWAEQFVQSFRRWREVCRIPAGTFTPGSSFVLTARTNLLQFGAETNAFSLRATFDSGGTRTGAGVLLSALENLPIWVNNPGTTATPYMTRLRQFHAGRTLSVVLYDIGDTSSGTVNLRLVPPPDSNVGGSWPCTITVQNGTGVLPALGANPSTCSMSGLNRNKYNAKIIRFDVALPETFTCDDSVPTGCWTKVEMNFAGAVPTDQTTWSAFIGGAPVRIVS